MAELTVAAMQERVLAAQSIPEDNVMRMLAARRPVQYVGCANGCCELVEFSFGLCCPATTRLSLLWLPRLQLASDALL